MTLGDAIMEKVHGNIAYWCIFIDQLQPPAVGEGANTYCLDILSIGKLLELFPMVGRNRQHHTLLGFA
jgi:hypothetical protein